MSAFLIGKMKADFEYKLITDIEDNIEEFIADLIEHLVLIADKLEDNYFNISDCTIKPDVKVTTEVKKQTQKQ